VGFSASAFRSLAPRAPLEINGQDYPVRDESLGVTTGISYQVPGEFDAHSVSLSYTAGTHHQTYAIGAANDPYSDNLSRPGDSFLGSVRVGWRYGNAYRPLYGVSNERGFTLNLSTDFAGPATSGGSGTLFAVEGRATGYLLAPWLSHHVFALALSGGSAGGSFARHDYYYKGGFVDSDAFGSITNGVRQSGFVLRGYAPNAFFGRQYNLANLEYRFPIVWLDRGVSTLPFLFHGMTGTLFADYGGAYDKLALGDPLGMYHLGVGGEISMTFVLGYFLETGLRIGWAKGLSDGAISGSQTYLVLAASF
jgi:outer membrane protein assembly factor BamA